MAFFDIHNLAFGFGLGDSLDEFWGNITSLSGDGDDKNNFGASVIGCSPICSK